jgi:hypothetical protein
VALIDLAPEWIKWPDEERRAEIGQVMRQGGFPGCIGFIDGTTVRYFHLQNECWDKKKDLIVSSSVSLFLGPPGRLISDC